ncbi:hypothetical protein ESCO_002523 [Escovopsis weberi]|uniref:Uncharacterized protein n=1 Tax=Escovopsis weberi TaxID=150374 RepID=A0A0M8N238_ESCWE|nr:hypothetical protein ESCO_002523 [Escovopsis weberi]
MLFKSSLLALALQVIGAFANSDPSEAFPGADDALNAPVVEPPATLRADIRASFADADILGLKLINGRPTTALLEVSNREDAPITVALVVGTLSSTQELPADAPAYQAIVRNLTGVSYNLAVDAGETKSVPYSFSQDLFPQDVVLRLTTVITNDNGDVFQVIAYEGPTAIVDPPTSFLDPQMYAS